MTISPVRTRLARASAFELRSKICAMNAFLLPQVTQAIRNSMTVLREVSAHFSSPLPPRKSYRVKDEYSSREAFATDAGCSHGKNRLANFRLETAHKIWTTLVVILD